MPEPTESQLLFDDVFEALGETVLGWCKRLGGPKVDAEDAAHEVFVVLLRRGHTVRDPAALPAWLFSVTRRVLAAHRRRAWVRRWVPGLQVERIGGTYDPPDPADQRELHDRVHAAVLALPARYREVIVLCELEERTDTEAAAILGISRETVKTRRRRGRERLRRALMGYARARTDLTVVGEEEP